MIGMLIRLALRAGVSARFARPLVIGVLAASMAAGAWFAWSHFIRSVEDRGGAKVERRVEREHSERVAEARHDERIAQDGSDAIAARTARAERKTDQILQSTIEELRNAMHDAPVAPAGGAGGPVIDPSGSTVRIDTALNALIDRANRAAAVAETGPSADPTGDAAPAQRPPER